MQDILARAKDIKLLIFDVDGVLTDGRIIIGDDGQDAAAELAQSRNLDPEQHEDDEGGG